MTAGNYIHHRRRIPHPQKLTTQQTLSMVHHSNRDLPDHFVTVNISVHNRIAQSKKYKKSNHCMIFEHSIKLITEYVENISQHLIKLLTF